MNGLTSEQIEYGAQQIQTGRCYLDFPPNAGQFRVLCKSMPEFVKPARSGRPNDAAYAEEKAKLSYDRSWFRNLAKEGKLRVWDDAIKSQPTLVELLKMTNLSVTDEGFENDTWFKAVMSAFKSYNRIR
jgi:hypothetical protein